jgi:putative membrane protein
MKIIKMQKIKINRIRMKKIKMNKFLTFLVVFVLLFSPCIPASPAFAQDNTSKEEVVYGILNLDGSINNLYVVNIFNGGEIVDYGNYSDIRNMTTSEKLNKEGDKITINTKAERFYYQGTLEKKELPWNIAIRYFLDGKEIPGEDLGGKSGSLKIEMSVEHNEKVSITFFDNYALQITFSLDSKLCKNIEAVGATIAEAGSKKHLTYTVLPGNEIDIVVTSNIHDFEMEPVTINGIRLSLDINVDSSEFKEQITELIDAIGKLDNGASELLTGVNQLSTGMEKYIDGMKPFKDGLGQLSVGADKLNEGATLLKNGLSQLSMQNNLVINGALEIQQAVFDSVNTQLSSMKSGLPELTPENYSSVISSIPQLTDVKKQLDGVVQFTQGLKNYTDGVLQLSNASSDLAIGISEFKASSSIIAESANELYNAATEINTAIRKLKDGLVSYKTGMNELRKGTAGMSSEIDSKINEILADISGGDGKVISFVSDKNTNVSSIQFVLKTDPIERPEIQEPDPPKPVRLNFWQKLLKLFGLYNK